MSGNYQGRRGPNVAHYLQDLNTIPTEEPVIDNFNPDDLALFTNGSQFFDFAGAEQGDSIDPSLKDEGLDLFSGLDNFENGFDFNFETGQSLQPTVPQSAVATTTSTSSASYNATSSSPTASLASPASSSRPSKRKASTANLDLSPKAVNMEEASRLAAEEDKRRRNTAASARFRVKKKQREQALEKTAKEMTARVTSLEEKVSQLEMENQLLKNLIVEKNKKKDDAGSESPSITQKNTDGVGTLGLVKSEN